MEKKRRMVLTILYRVQYTYYCKDKIAWSSERKKREKCERMIAWTSFSLNHENKWCSKQGDFIVHLCETKK